jgi:O-antigen ligase
MTAAAVRLPERAIVPAACGAAAVFGAMIAVKPAFALALLGLAGIVALAFLRPVAHLTLILAVTTILPYAIQNRYGPAGGAGLVLSDVLILVALLRALLILVRQPLEPRRTLVMAAIGAMLAIATLQAVRGRAYGADLGQVGYELRVLLGWSTIAIAIPLLADSASRMRLLKGMLGVGIAVGIYGLLQYFELLTFFVEGQAGLREGVRFTSAGKGQIQGGLFAFPVCVLIGFAALTSGAVRSRAGQIALLVLIGLNAIGLLLTYERTFWLATVLGIGFIAVRAGFAQRLRVAVLILGMVLVLAPVTSTVAPGALSAASERLLSLNQYGSDDSVRYRLQEGRHVIDKIQAHPLVGWGLADEVFYGLPWLQTPPSVDSFAHNGYLWLAWKIGIPGAMLLFAVIAWAIVARAPPGIDPLYRAVRLGAQASLLLMAVISITFPSFSALNITAVGGLLLAICLGMPGPRRDRAATTGP